MTDAQFRALAIRVAILERKLGNFINGGTGELTNGDKGDITVSGGGATWTIDNDAVTYAKMQPVSANDRLLGADTAGDVTEISLSSSDLEFTGTNAIRNRFIGARVHNNAVAQAVPNNSGTALTASTESFDTDALHSTTSATSRLTAPVDGYYFANCSLFWASNATGKRVVDFRINATTFVATRDEDPNDTVLDPHMGTDAILQLSTNDYVEVVVFQNSGGDLDCTLTEFSLVRLPGA